MQLLLQSVLHDLRQFLAIKLMCLMITDIRQCLVTVRDHRRTLVRAHRRHHIDPVCNLIGIGNHHLFRLVTAKVGKFLQHLLCGSKIKRSLLVRIRKALARHNDPAVNLILRVKKMNVAGGNHRLAEFLTQSNDPPIHIHHILHAVDGRHLIRFDHELVVPKRLDFQVIIKVDKPCDLCFRLPLNNSPVQLSCLAGTSQNKPLSVLHQKALRHTGTLAVVGQMGFRNQSVQVFSSDVILRKDNGMIGRKPFYDLRAGISHGIYLCKGICPCLLQHGNKFHKDFRGSLRIIHCAVMIFQGYSHSLCHCIQRVLRLMREQNPGHSHRIHVGKFP